MKLRVLHIIPSLRKGGAERLVLDICKELQSRSDVEVRLLTFRDENEYLFLSQQIVHVVVPAKAVPSVSGSALVDVSQLMAYIDAFKPHVVHSHLFEAEIVSRWELRDGICYFSHCHDNMFQFKSLGVNDLICKRRITELHEKRILVRRYVSCNNRFIAISEHTRNFFSENLPAKLSKRITVLRNAINYDRFAVAHSPIDCLSLINVGSFVAKKNQAFLIYVAKELRNRGMNFRFILVGDGELRVSVEDLICREGLQSFFELPGSVPDVERYYAQSDIYVHSATYEPFGLVLLEAMAAGLPVVCLNAGGNADIMHNGENGFMFDEANAGFFADKIIEFSYNKTLYGKMSNFSRLFARQYDIKEYVDTLLTQYLSCVEK